MSNLCSEILQVSEPNPAAGSTRDLTFAHVGKGHLLQPGPQHRQDDGFPDFAARSAPPCVL